MPLKIIVVGCGLGGLVTAISILHYSKGEHEIVLIERTARIQEIGARLTLMPNGLRILRQFLDFQKAGLDSSSPGGQKILDLATGADLTGANSIVLADEVEKRGGWLHIHRGDLQAALLEHVKEIGGDRVTFMLGTEAARMAPQTASVTLADGRVLEADVLIGADGIKSVSRPTMFPNFNTLVSAAYAYRFQLPAKLFYDDPVLSPLMGRHTMYVCGPFRIVVYPIRKNTIANHVILCPPNLFSTEEIGWSAKTDPNEVYENLHKSPGGLCEAAEKILALMKEHADVRTWRIADRAVLESYSINRAALIGDAAHAMTPALGQGVNMAIEDAAVLGKLLAGATKDTVPEALSRYSALRVPRAGTVQLASRMMVSRDFKITAVPPVDGRSFATDDELHEWLWDTDVMQDL